MALEDFFDGDHQKVQAVIDHFKWVAERFEPPAFLPNPTRSCARRLAGGRDDGAILVSQWNAATNDPYRVVLFRDTLAAKGPLVADDPRPPCFATCRSRDRRRS